MKAVLFVGHGSRDPEGNEQILQFVKEFLPELNPLVLYETCFLEFARPGIEKGIQNCVEKGATSIALIPLMLLPAGHSKIHIPAAIDAAKAQYPDVAFTYGKPIGIHYETSVILRDRLQDAGVNPDEAAEDDAVILLGRGGSDADANSDLCKIARILWEKTSFETVEPAFYGVTKPSLPQAVEKANKLGVKKITILPYFLFTGVLIKRIEEDIVTFNTQYPHIEFTLADYFGFHPKLKTIIADRMDEALGESVAMNCDTCQYRFEAGEHHHHHHHHDHDGHDHHHHDHDHDHHHEEEAVR
ncbi:sirohydrochlorin chelatase [Domibacillus antri]|uniref:Sirohydrochlorin chelatase n=1 Tax=Domibacillus antri TaxID=1714264 RepID=A0A1Q8Q3Q6_9BACI|nr:sirohydrochlorin chelatase [Domibacillus antri]OLN21957.1 sirohydrochlorin chelatase [Domibacillus antri]